jgi:hypothetical protein
MLLLGILLIAAGILAAASLIVAKQPNAQEMISKLVPFQGIIGIILLLFGLYFLFAWVFPGLGILSYFPLTGIAWLASTLVAIALGILLGYGLISQYALSKNADAARSGEAVRAKLTTYQVPLGIAGIALGIWLILLHFSWSSFARGFGGL